MNSMKKILIFSLLAFLVSGMISCSSCNKNKEKENTEVVTDLNVENCISADREKMFLSHGKDYRWFETCMRLKSCLDEDNDGTLEELVNIFQVIIDSESGYDTKVYKFQHFSDGVIAQDSTIGFWVEDSPLETETIKITYKEAFDKLMATNLPKPHSRYCTLRKQVGPKPCNPQYIFGNTKSQIYVDAVNGNVTDKNPAFEGGGFKMPLGEWP